jgi:hypothetical protein
VLHGPSEVLAWEMWNAEHHYVLYTRRIPCSTVHVGMLLAASLPKTQTPSLTPESTQLRMSALGLLRSRTRLQFRATKRIFAEIDLDTAFKDTLIPHQKFFDAVLHLMGLDLEAKDDCYRKVVRDLLQECLDLEVKLSTRLWQCGKLHVFAPWGEVGVFFRVVLSVGLLLLKGFFCLRIVFFLPGHAGGYAI